MGLISPTEGSAEVAGFKLGVDDQSLRRQVGVLTEASGLLAFAVQLFQRETILTRWK